MSEKKDILAMLPDELEDEIRRMGEKPFRARQHRLGRGVAEDEESGVYEMRTEVKRVRTRLGEID